MNTPPKETNTFDVESLDETNPPIQIERTKEGTLPFFAQQLLESFPFVISGPKTIYYLSSLITTMPGTTFVVITSSSTTLPIQNTPTRSQQSSTLTVVV